VKAELRAVFAQKTVTEWRTQPRHAEGPVGAASESPDAVVRSAAAREWAPRRRRRRGRSTFKLVSNPVQFDETPPELSKGPEAGQHTEEILLERGIAWERIAELKKSGAIN
jgi:crotonobetainyl-CoA:carnitine CoA-transferase CaiB-like acyl-CoA transferase